MSQGRLRWRALFDVPQPSAGEFDDSPSTWSLADETKPRAHDPPNQVIAANGNTYEGEWARGQPHGQGKQTRADGVISEGAWSEGKFVFGKRTFPSGEVQQGTFVDGKLHGPACIRVGSNGDRYEGAMRFGHREGVGQFDRFAMWNSVVANRVSASFQMYQGQWSNDRRSGFGVQRIGRKTIQHCGLWKDDEFISRCPVPRSALPEGALPHPDDTLLLTDGLSYRGPLDSDFRPHGQGSMHRKDGSEESRGDWLNGVQTGLGLLHLSNGDVFEGQLKNGTPKGFGVLWNADGELLQCGEWGNGWLRQLDSRPVPCRFIPFGDKLNAVSRDASLLYPNGEFFVGELSGPNEDQPNGAGKLYWSHAVVKQEGMWVNGVYTAPALPPLDDAVLSLPSSLPVAFPAHDQAMDVDSGLKSADATRLPEIPGTMASPASNSPRRRSALCIGNNTYAPPLQPLTCCWTDAERMGCALQRLKFDSSVVRTDLNYSSLNNEINAFIDSLKQQRYGPGDLALLYFSGHGCELGTNNVYLLPTDIGCEDADQGGLSVQMLKRRFNRALNGAQVVFIFDCCRVSEAVNLSALYEQALEDRCEAETRAAKEEAAEKLRNRKQQEAEKRQPRPFDYDDSSDSEPSQSLSSSSVSLPAIRWQASTAPHADDLTRNSFAVLYSCDTGYLATTGWKEGSIFTHCILEQMQADDADLSIVGLLGRTNARMQEVTAPLRKPQIASAEIAPIAKEAITLAAA